MSLAQQTSRIWRLNFIALWALIATVSVFAGLMLRDWTWKQTAPIRFTGDVSNALNVGRETVMSAVNFEQGKPPALPDWPSLWKAYLGRYDIEFNRFAARRDAGMNVEGRYRFDYPPGRLLIASAWAKEVVSGVPPGAQRPRGMGTLYNDEYIAPLRWTNIGHELAGALGMFFLVRRVFLNAGRRMFASEGFAMLAAMLLWFNPALILDAHGWPQWEAWVLPYTLWAAYFALIDWWLLAGALLAGGAMLKGQVLMIAPIFPLWALFSLRFGALVRFASGFFAAVALLMWPWLVRDSLPAVWIIGGTLAFATFLITMHARRSLLSIIAFSLLLGTLSSPWVGTHVDSAWLIVVGIATFAASSLFVVWRSRPAWTVLVLSLICMIFAALLPAGVAAAIDRAPPEWLTIAMPRWSYRGPIATDMTLLKNTLGLACGIVGLTMVSKRRSVLPASLAMFAVLSIVSAIGLNGSFAWLHVGFQTVRYEELFMGRVCNLAAILQKSFALDVSTPVSDFGVFSSEVLLSPFLKSLATIGVALCALALSIQVRRRDPNALIAFAAAWTLLYALLPQMHERYLVWGAVVSAVMATRGVAGLLVHLVLTALQFSMILFAMATSYGRGERIEALQPWLRVFEGLQPEAGYIVLTLAFVLLGWSFRRSVPRLPKPRKVTAPKVLLRESVPVVGDKRPPINTADAAPASA